MYNDRRKANVSLLMTNQRSCYGLCVRCMERVSVQQIVWSHELITGCVDISDSGPESGMRWGWIQDQTGSISIMWRWSQPETTGSHSQQPGSAATATTTDQQQISLSSSVVGIKHLICLFFFVMIQLKNSLCLDNCCSHGPLLCETSCLFLCLTGPGSGPGCC